MMTELEAWSLACQASPLSMRLVPISLPSAPPISVTLSLFTATTCYV